MNRLNQEQEEYLITLVEQGKQKIKNEYEVEIKEDIVIDMSKSFEEARALIIQAFKDEKNKILNFRDENKSKEKIKNPFKNITLKQYKHIISHMPDRITPNDADKTLDYEGVVAYVKTEYGIEIPQAIGLKEAKEQIELEEAKLEKEQLEAIREEEKKTLEEWKEQFNPDMIINSKAYFEMEKYIEMVCNSFSNFVVIRGEGGLGKTFVSQAILRREKINYAYLNSFTTPVGFYNFLYDNANDKIILIDDTSGIWDNQPLVSILKNATEINGKRTISWNSSTSKLEHRMTTTSFNSRIILLTNQIPNFKNPHIQALLSRAFVSDLKFTYQEKLDIIKEVSKRKYQGIKAKERKEIFDFIQRNTNEATDFNIRTLIKCYHFYMFNKQIWKELAITLLKVDRNKEVALELMKGSMPVKEQIKVYYEKTNRSRADFFRIKKQLLGK